MDGQYPKHLKFIDTLPCVICRGVSTHHHLLRVDPKYLSARAGEERFSIPKCKSKGTGTKSDDRFTLPLCGHHHSELHDQWGDERAFFGEHFILAPDELALQIFAVSGDYKSARKAINEAIRQGRAARGSKNEK